MRSSGGLARRVTAAALIFGAAACAAPLFVLPAGPGEPAPDAASAWTAATAVCRTTAGLTATLRVSGSVGGDKFPTTISVLTGVTAQGIDMEGVAAGRKIFRLAGDDRRATLYLDDGHRYATGTPEELTDALVGVKVGPARWLALVSGCAVPPGDLVSAARYPTVLAVTTGSGRAYLASTATGSWRIVGGVFDDLIVGYRWAPEGPEAWSLTSEPGRDPAVSLSVKVEDLQLGHAPDPAKAFQMDLADAVAITLADLRQSGPLRKKGQ